MAVQSVQTCKWSIPTLFLPWPLWYDASEADWSCTRTQIPRGLPDPACCSSCARWAARGLDQADPHEAHLGSVCS